MLHLTRPLSNMKELYLFLLFLFGLGTSAQIVAIPDPVFKAKLLAANTTNYIARNEFDESIAIDANANGEIEVSECTNVVAFNLAQSSISDLTGIAAFVNLKTLVCQRNFLTELDVSGLPALEILQCFENQLTQLDVSGLDRLERLFCENNDIQQLHLDGCIALTHLYCNGNNIAQLNLDGLSSIELIYCYQNQLTALDLSGQPNLKNLDCTQNNLTTLTSDSFQNLLTLYCSRNQLSSIDLSTATQLTHFQCGNNLLQSLDLTGLNALILLACEQNFLTDLDLSDQSNLGYLNCSHNLLTTLDCSNQGQLVLLYCFNNALTSLYIKNGAIEQDTWFGGNPNLAYICADSSQLASVSALALQNGNAGCLVDDSCVLSTQGFAMSSNSVIYPNPVADILNIGSKTPIESIHIYNLLGQVVLSMASVNSVDVSALEPGTYLVRVYGDGRDSTSKFIKL